jgi:hypothetical protein
VTSKFAAILLLSFSVWAFGQAPPPASHPAGETPATSPKAAENPKAAEAPGASLPADTPVITVQGLCATATGSATQSSPDCKTVITKGQFEEIVNAVVPKFRRAELPPTALQQIAHQYSMLLVMAEKGKQQNLEASPTVQEQLKLSHDQVLAQAYNQKLQDESQPTDAEVEKYYNENPSSFEEVTLQRLYIPKAIASKEKPVDATAEKAAAEKLRQRAAAGEDFTKLQKEAFANQPNSSAAPSTDMGARRRGTLPPDQENAVFSLNAGQVSALLENPAGWYVYKVTAKRKVPLTEAKEEISRKLQQQKYMDLRNAATNSVDARLNEAYFGPSAPEMMPGMPHMPSGPSSKKPANPATPQSQPGPKH